jgi:hypothetical protein
MKRLYRRGNSPTLQTVQRIDTGLPYHTLDTRRLRNASPLQTNLVAKRSKRKMFWIIVGVGFLLLFAVVLASRPAHGAAMGQVVCGWGHSQAICPPWHEVADPPRLYWVALPIVEK